MKPFKRSEKRSNYRGPYPINRVGCPSCGGRILQTYYHDRTRKGTITDFPTPYHYCLNCKKILKVKLLGCNIIWRQPKKLKIMRSQLN